MNIVINGKVVEVPDGSYGNELFKSAPACVSLKDIAEPKPEHMRACIMELIRYVITLQGRIETLEDKLRSK